MMRWGGFGGQALTQMRAGLGSEDLDDECANTTCWSSCGRRAVSKSALFRALLSKLFDGVPVSVPRGVVEGYKNRNQ